MEHAKLSASGSARWLNCPGSINGEEGLPDTAGHAARWGTVAHKLAQLCLETGNTTASYNGHYVAAEEDDITDIAVDEEMISLVEGYLTYVYGIATPGSALFVEQRVDFSPWTLPGQFGTADAIVIIGDTLHVIDLKTGRNGVAAVGNTQARLYALGTWNELGWVYSELTTVVIHIYAPRVQVHHSGDDGTWTQPIADVLEWGETVVRPAAQATLPADAPRTPGEKQCQWCKLRGSCKALAEYNIRLMHTEFDSIDPVLSGEQPLTGSDPLNMSHDEIGSLLPLLDVITNWVKGVKAHAMTLLQQGEQIPGAKLVYGSANRRWVSDERAQTWVEANLDKNKTFENKMLSLAKLEKIVKAEKDPTMLGAFAQLWEKPQGNITMVADSDKREGIVLGEALNASAAKDFA